MLTHYSGTKSNSNPIVKAEPEHLDVTGFRDPSVVPWPSMDRLLGRTEGKGLYALISGGVQNLGKTNTPSSDASPEGPRLFLYDLDPTDLTQWRYLSTLGKTFPRNLTPHRWTGDFGTNWECATVFPLRHTASGLERDVCILGVEGGSLRKHVGAYRKGNADKPERAARYAHWFFPSLELGRPKAGTDEGFEQVDMRYHKGGLVDWAELYAFATFPHPDGRRIALGWLVELDLSDELAAAKGWTGCLGLPREFELLIVDGVVGTLAGTTLEEIGSFDVVADPADAEAKRVITMGIAPLKELETLRGTALLLDGINGSSYGSEMPECYELYITALIPSAESTFSVQLRSSPDAASLPVCTSITFNPSAETITIHREHSSTTPGICLQDEIAPFTLLRFANGSIEQLDLRVFVDRDVIEVFANGRVSMSTRVYAPKEANRMRIDVGGGAEVTECKVWEMGSIGLPE